MRINHLTRRELYEAVWKTPKAKLAVEYGISDVALAKICKKMNIPIPGRGYWQKLKAGKGVQYEPLPDFSENSHISIQDLRSEMFKKDAKRIARLNEDRHCKTISNTNFGGIANIVNFHSLARRAKTILEKIKVNEKGLLSAPDKYCLAIRVSPTQLDRALAIMSSVILTLEDRQFKVTIDQAENGYETIASVENERLSFRIEENTFRTKRIFSKDELKKRFRWEPEYEYIFKPTGKLALKIINTEAVHARKLWSDTTTQRVEGQIGSFVSGLIKAAVAVKTRRFDLEKQREEHAAFKRKRYEMLEKIRNEEVNVAKLEQNAALWKKSQDIREYIAAVMGKAKNDEEFARNINAESWFVWALEQADRLDPLIKSPPSVLDEKNKYLGLY